MVDQEIKDMMTLKSWLLNTRNRYMNHVEKTLPFLGPTAEGMLSQKLKINVLAQIVHISLTLIMLMLCYICYENQVAWSYLKELLKITHDIKYEPTSIEFSGKVDEQLMDTMDLSEQKAKVF